MSDTLARLRGWCRRESDWVAAGVLTAISAVILVANGLLTSLDSVPVSICLLGFTALVGWRRRRPVVIASLAGVLVAVPWFTPYSSAVDQSALAAPGFAAVFLYAYALGSGCRWAPSLVGLVPLTVGVALTTTGFNPFIEMATVGPWLVGLVVASRRRAADQLALRARELEEERELFAVLSVRYERARIARELHDIVAHGVSLMVVQASAGEHLAQRDPASALQAFDSITTAAREAEAEIDRLVEMLDTRTLAAPSAGLRIVGDLVARVRASGLTVSCQFSGDCEDLSDEASEAIYRLVQEAVTNAIKHAPGAPIEVTVCGQVDAVEVRVVNDAEHEGASGLEDSGGGHGLAGMRERVTRCSGTFSAGPTAERGWCVTARLPRHPQMAELIRERVLPWG